MDPLSAWALFISQLAGGWPPELRVSVAEADCRKGPSFRAETAVTPESQRRGLSGRQSLAEDAGMLFVMDPPRDVAFWMKETLIPLTILFFDARGALLSVQEMAVEPDPARPVRHYREKDVSAVLELKGGLAQTFQPGSHFLCVGKVSES